MDKQRLLMKCDEIEWSVRLANCLKRNDIIYIGDLVQKTEFEMLCIPHLGRVTLGQIVVTLESWGLHLGMHIPDWPPENIEGMRQWLFSWPPPSE